jgi:hypothetical protein
VRPPPRRPYYITGQSLQQLRGGFLGAAGTYRKLAIAFGGLGVYLIVRKALRRWLRARRELRARRMLQDAVRAREARRRLAAAGGGGGGEEAAEERDADTCVVCIEEQACMAFVACGHLCACAKCSKQLKRCPVCRTASDCIRVYRM